MRPRSIVKIPTGCNCLQGSTLTTLRWGGLCPTYQGADCIYELAHHGFPPRQDLKEVMRGVYQHYRDKRTTLD